MENNFFITKILINKVRHLENIEILLDEQKRKHLILTGKNGSGKTSVLEFLKEYLTIFQGNGIRGISSNKQTITTFQNTIKQLENKLLDSQIDQKEKLNIEVQLQNHKNALKQYQGIQEKYDFIVPEIRNDLLLENLYKEGNFILCYFDARRNSRFQEPGGIKKLSLKHNYQIEEKAGNLFLQYIVNLKADKSFARDDGKEEVVKSIDSWFFKFEGLLKEIFEDESLLLEFDSKNYTFYIVLKNREKINFNTLSDGYSAILNIVTELILRMEEKSSKIYDVQGVVLIDEIETHLHIELQKKILPFLTTLFPAIQFIVSTHSPFVLNSIENAVIYDLENKFRVNNLSSYSIDGIVENYFDVDKYSDFVKSKLDEYEILVKKENLTENEKERCFELKTELKKIPENFAPELVLKFQQIELERVRR